MLQRGSSPSREHSPSLSANLHMYLERRQGVDMNVHTLSDLKVLEGESLRTADR